MKPTLMLVLAALPFAACDLPAPDEAAQEIGSSPSALKANPDPWVDFDRVGFYPFTSTLPSTLIPANTIVDGTYQGYGVTLSCAGPGCGSAHVYTGPVSNGTNGVTVFAPPSFTMFDERWGKVRATFTTPRTWASVDARAIQGAEGLGTPQAKPWLRAYDSIGTLIGTVEYPSYGAPGWGSWQGLLFNAGTARIKYIEFASYAPSNGPSVYGEFDNVLCNGDPLPMRMIGPERTAAFGGGVP
jgi:hypothetical protein